jgi:hypothetical protein
MTYFAGNINVAAAVGTQELKVQWTSTSSLTIGSGKIEINGTVYELASSVTLNVTGLSTSTWYYVYVTGGLNSTLGLSNISYSTTAPTLSESKKGYYNGTAVRCIGAFYSDGSSNVLEFSVSGLDVYWDESFSDHDDNTPSDTWTDQALTVPLLGDGVIHAHVMFYLNRAGSSDSTVYYRKNGSSGGGNYIGYLADANGRYQSVTATVPVDATGKIETKFGTADATNQLAVYNRGFRYPPEIYTGVAGTATADSGLVESTFEAYEEVAVYNLNDETLNAVISNVEGDTNDMWVIEAHLKNTDTSTTGLFAQLNSDTNNNYSYSLMGVHNDGSSSVAEGDTEAKLYLGAAPSGEGVSIKANLFLKSGINRKLVSSSMRDDRAYQYFSRWENTADEVTSIKVFTDYDVTGTIRVFKKKRVLIPTSGRVLYREYNLNDETLDATLDGLQGDTDKIWEIEAHFAGTDTSSTSLMVQLNGDTSTNYGLSYSGVDATGGASVGEVDSLAYMDLGTTLNSGYTAYTVKLFLKSGLYRFASADVNRNDRAYRFYSRWTNTADEVTSMRIYTDHDVTGYVRIYKWQ